MYVERSRKNIVVKKREIIKIHETSQNAPPAAF